MSTYNLRMEETIASLRVQAGTLLQEIETQAEEIRILRAGECRFHCRTAKDNFIAGFTTGRFDLNAKNNLRKAEEAYDEWKRQRS